MDIWELTIWDCVEHNDELEITQIYSSFEKAKKGLENYINDKTNILGYYDEIFIRQIEIDTNIVKVIWHTNGEERKFKIIQIK